MNRLTEDLLALASVESPDYKLAVQPIRASALVQDAIESLGGMVVDSELALASAGAPDACVMADPDAMNQVFGNLIENAVKYGKDREANCGRCAAGWMPKSNSSCRTLGPASHLNIWSESSSAFIASIRLARANQAAQASGLPS